jgi:TPR repeat protein
MGTCSSTQNIQPPNTIKHILKKRVSHIEDIPEDSDEQYTLGLKYYRNADYKNAKKLLHISAANPRSQYMLGYIYCVIDKDHKLGILWYKKSAKQNYKKAQNRLGEMFYKGLNVSKNYKKAVKLFNKSAAQGDINAQYNLAKMYYKGEGVPQDYQKSLELYTQSAKQGSKCAQYKLGYMYENGVHVNQDYERAVEWYTKSAKLKFKKSKKHLNFLLQQKKFSVQEYLNLKNDFLRLKVEKIVRKYIIVVLSEIIVSYI